MSRSDKGADVVPIEEAGEAQRKPSPSAAGPQRSADFWRHFRWHRIFTQRIPIAGATPASTIMVSITEVDRPDPSGKPFVGLATMKIYNVAPGDGFVVVRGEIDWDSDRNIRLNIFLF